MKNDLLSLEDFLDNLEMGLAERENGEVKSSSKKEDFVNGVEFGLAERERTGKISVRPLRLK